MSNGYVFLNDFSPIPIMRLLEVNIISEIFLTPSPTPCGAKTCLIERNGKQIWNSLEGDNLANGQHRMSLTNNGMYSCAATFDYRIRDDVYYSLDEAFKAGKAAYIDMQHKCLNQIKVWKSRLDAIKSTPTMWDSFPKETYLSPISGDIK